MVKSNKKEKRTAFKGILDKIMYVDLFGESIGFQIEGSSSYPSVCGTVLSLFIFAFVVIYVNKKT